MKKMALAASIDSLSVIDHVGNIFTFCGGLGMFLYGMHIMSDGIQRSADDRMRQLLGILTNNRVLAILVGALITAIIQSSGATTVMVVGFVNAGLMGLGQAVGVIMGANIGTCITAWIVSMESLGDAFQAMSPSLYAPLLIGIGAFFAMFAKKQGKKLAGQILVGLGLLFLGLDFMKDGVSIYTELPIFINAFRLFGENPILGIAIGALVTALIQSSSASVGILQMLASTGGVVTTASAVYISLGSNIGSCVTALISSVGTPRNAKRAAVIHLSFNVIGTILFGVGGFILFRIFHALGEAAINSVGISIFHTIFNIACTVLLFPFADFLVKLSGKLVPEKKKIHRESDTEEKTAYRHLDERILESPAFAVESVRKEVIHMGKVTLDNVRLAMESVYDRDPEKIKKVYENEKTINNLDKILTEYLVKVNNLSLSEDQHFIIRNLFYTINDIERVGDHAENIAEKAEYMFKNDFTFSSMGAEDLKIIADKAIRAYANAVDCRETNSRDSLRKVISMEDDVDMLEEEFRDKHIARLSSGECNTSSGVVFLEIMGDLERISDHAMNIAGYVKDEM
ncbi:MAG: Na/Pi cotransporter family protein [Lachnospiraceae bacterium]